MLSLRSPISLGAALSASLAVSLLSVSPAQAQATEAPSGNEWPGGVDGTSQPAACGEFVLGASIFGNGFACTSGDKIYSSFIKNLDPGNKLQTSIFQFTIDGSNHTISSIGNFTPGTYEFGYTMTIFNALNTEQALQSANTSASSSSISNPRGLSPSWTKTLDVQTNDESLFVTTTQLGATTNSDGPKTFGALVQPVSADFISRLFVPTVPGQPNTVTSITDTVTQKFDETATVPGPLPILGAAAAFGFSRKLRSRIKQTV